jgi:hypothetical protein
MGVSRREYARLRGVSESAVRKALATGRITAEPDGTIDPAKADAQWAAATDPAKQRARHARAMAAATTAATASAQAAIAASARVDMKPVPAAAIDAVRDTLHEEGQDPEPGEAPGGEVSFLRARLANEILKAQTAKVRLGKMKGELIDRARAVSMVFDLARRERDAWIGWPPRVAANMAAELGIDPHRVEQVLDRYLREHLAELGEVRVDLR